MSVARVSATPGEDAFAQRGDARTSGCRPTCEPPCRATREPRAPFVAAPPAPRVATAPRVADPLSRGVAGDACGATYLVRSSTPPPLVRPLVAVAPPDACAVVATFEARDVRAAVDALRARGCSVEPIAAVPGARGQEDGGAVAARTVRRASVVATIAAALAAPVGAALLRGEAYLPSLGWWPASALSAAAAAGAIGALAFAIAVIVLLSWASPAAPLPARWLIVARVRPELLRELVASHGGVLLSRCG
ncbi:MAG: hypothetical protein HYV09_26320 [Deltaproteobacteria bacterium]|nr:hypothetical protein [Deltaproteobacteria bacterium]